MRISFGRHSNIFVHEIGLLAIVLCVLCALYQVSDMIVGLIKVKSDKLAALRTRIGYLMKLKCEDPKYGWDSDDE